MKTLLINPWAYNNDEHYTSGFVSGLNEYVELDAVVNTAYQGTMPNGKCYKKFFAKSQKMKRGWIRSIIRGLEYILTYIFIIRLCKKKKYDVIHIHWLLQYSFDTIFIKLLKLFCGKIVLTAHNVIPHENGEKYLKKLRKIYELTDRIIVHGDEIKSEFKHYFPQYEGKVAIQYHGIYHNQNIYYEYFDTDEYKRVAEKINEYSRVFIMFGLQFFNKGTDRLLNIWNKNFNNADALLIITGKISDDYVEMRKEMLEKSDNVLILDYFLDVNLLNYCIDKSQIILIPYRHASMSGIVFTAAAFSKMPICTKVGAIAEYLADGEDSILCDNDCNAIFDAIKEGIALSDDEIISRGKKLRKNIYDKYSWKQIAKKLVHEVYLQ